MKHADKNEIDILLRGLAKNLQSADDVDSQLVDEHLDPDELNSYAEDVLPAPTRARYTVHLADCSSCRKQVANLAAARAPVREAQPVLPSKTFWQRLAPIFAPSVLRFAVPALALSTLIVVGLVVLQQSSEFTARRQATEPATSPNTAPATSVTQEQTKDRYGDATTPTANTSITETNAEQRTQKGQKEQTASATPEEKQTTSSDTSTAVAQPSYAPDGAASASAPPAPAAKTVSEKRSEDADASKPAAPTEQQRARAESEKKDEGQAVKNEAATVAGRRVESLPTAGRRAMRSDDDSVRDKKKAVAKEDTRSVAGRTFRRDGNAWVDTAFNSSVSVVNVRRGSEQFRSLTADEPGLKTISEHFSGTVIVVWKGRAYRIQ